MGTRFKSKSETKVGPPPSVNMLGHCVFCLRKTTSDRNLCNRRLRQASEEDATMDLVQVVPRADFRDHGVSLPNSSLLKCLNRVWECVHKKGGNIGDGGEEEDVVSFERRLRDMAGTEQEDIFSVFPSMCHFCAGKLIAVDKMMRELMEMLDNIGGIVRESKGKGGRYSWRGENFLKTLRSSNLERSAIRQTIKLLGMEDDQLNSTRQDEVGASDYFQQNLSESDSNGPDPDPMTSFESVKFREDSDHADREKAAALNFINEKDPDDMNVKLELELALAEDEDNEAILFHDVGDDDLDARGDFGDDSDGESDPDYIKTEIEMEEEDGESLSDSSEEEAESGLAAVVPLDGEGELAVKSEHDLSSAPITDLGAHSSQKPGTRTARKSRHSRAAEQNATFSKSVDPTTNEEMYTCTIDGCGRSFRKELKSLRCHQRIVHKVTMPEERHCLVCGKSYGSRAALASHLKKKHPTHAFRTSTQKCDLCKKHVPLIDISEHVEGHVGKEHVLKCPNRQCPFVFIFSRFLNKHVNRNKACKESIPNLPEFLNPVHKCDTCGFSTPNPKVLSGHVSRNHETTEKPFPCPVQGCQKRFTVKQSVSLHLPYHYNDVSGSSKKDKQFQCEKCDKVYSSNLALNTHKWNKHKDTSVSGSIKRPRESFKPQKCEECGGEEFKSKSALRGHNILVHGKDWYTCKLCGEKFTTVSMLSKHTREHTGKVLEFKCDFPGCDKIFKEKWTLNNHVSFVHQGDRSNSCDICGKVYSNPKSLLGHKKVAHLGIRSHVCEVCGDSFTVASALKNHRLIHTGERPFACEICGQRFRHRNVLRTHLEGHEKKGDGFKPNGPMKGIRKRKGSSYDDC